jgi:hypothetical protein
MCVPPKDKILLNKHVLSIKKKKKVSFDMTLYEKEISKTNISTPIYVAVPELSQIDPNLQISEFFTWLNQDSNDTLVSNTKDIREGEAEERCSSTIKKLELELIQIKKILLDALAREQLLNNHIFILYRLNVELTEDKKKLLDALCINKQKPSIRRLSLGLIDNKNVQTIV